MNFSFLGKALIGGLFLLLGLVPLSAQDNNSIITAILDDYSQMMDKNIASEDEDLPRETWNVIVQAINDGFLRFTVNPDKKGGLVEGVSFQITPTMKTQYIVFSSEFLELYDQNPAAVFAVITREFKSARDFFMNPQVMIDSSQDPLGQALFRADAIIVETLLIRDRLTALEYSLGPYEEYLLESFEKDGLTSATLFLEQFSLPFATGLQGARLNFEENKNEEELRDFIIETGTQIKEEWEEIDGEDASIVYPAVVITNSWLVFTPWAISRIYNYDKKDQEIKTFEEIRKLESVYEELYTALSAIRDRELFLMEQVNTATKEGFIPR